MKAVPVEKRCISCGAVRTHSVEPLRLTPEDVAYAGHGIAVCSACGLRSSHPMPEREELRRWYADGHAVPHEWPVYIDPVRWVWHRVHDRTLVGMLAAHAPSGTLLDVGAGNGRFARAAGRSGRWRIIATEYAGDSIDTLRAQAIDARVGNIDEVDIADASIDIVWASHLLEHLPDLETFLAAARRVLRPGGILATLVPSNRSLRARLHLSAWHYVNPPGHLWGFSPETFRRILENNGFAVEFQREVHVVCEMFTIARAPAAVEDSHALPGQLRTSSPR